MTANRKTADAREGERGAKANLMTRLQLNTGSAAFSLGSRKLRGIRHWAISVDKGRVPCRNRKGIVGSWRGPNLLSWATFRLGYLCLLGGLRRHGRNRVCRP